ncbi:MAG: hypothetical protein COV91_00645 [Candidatus Taylorbacteria bacterium CG11_big_fil_rev_8_21_14_0_20_46_11]|uniref:HAD family hydrolase n=1 Tax=Candidatus Taylorbacteria bacterium CG11_big_fil_rev_8_21_14_0_20_46_11 TaxID=1975025 RepID=A0A2H0KCV5_9BACT|nr:MAG: hypothetical protein COV91_00645 [Candidatus Taylorbacteria bacterium CG11_big_fil_rev_8_21_14_0_20_46_11]
MKTKAVLFDNDGTLLNSLPEAYRATCTVLAEAGCTSPSFQEYLRYCHPPFPEFYKRYGLDESDEVIWARFLKVANFDTAELFPDTLNVLGRLSSNGRVLGLVSAQLQDILDRLCTQHAVTPFFKAGVVAVKNAKDEAILTMCTQAGVDPSRACYVGDHASDMKAARKAGVKAIGITRGNETEAVLREAGADVIITHLEELEGHL